MRIAPNLDPASLLPPFESSVPTLLRLSGERALLSSHGLTRETYSTKSFLSESLGSSIAVLEGVGVGGGNALICEASSAELARYAVDHGLNLASDADALRATGLMKTSLRKVIKPYQFLWSAVSELAWRCHVVDARDDDHDVSFSDPAIPFSVFISAPSQDSRSSVLRVAENLIHETMHLQLTLFEESTPLVDATSSWSMFSPWKRQKRSTQGILHGLYVFCVLRWMWKEVLQTTPDEADRDFAIRRVMEIDQQVSEVHALEQSPALTEDGRKFLLALSLA